MTRPVITPEERALIDAYPRHKVKRIPAGQSAIPQPVWCDRKNRLTDGLGRSGAMRKGVMAFHGNMARAARLRRAEARAT